MRDTFLYKVPLLAPADFKPLNKHKVMCKICYENKINCALKPCKCMLFCMDCAITPDALKITCPVCGMQIEELVRIYDARSQLRAVR